MNYSLDCSVVKWHKKLILFAVFLRKSFALPNIFLPWKKKKYLKVPNKIIKFFFPNKATRNGKILGRHPILPRKKLKMNTKR